MTETTKYPVSLLLDGPLFMDELDTQPQHFRREHDIESLRLVPSKSAASGVYTVFFRPEHRQWALVRLATRYRGLFEIQLQRGMSGEHQLLRQGFDSDDLAFLFDIIPHPPDEYSPIVYDMLWLVATYDQYLVLSKALADRDTFRPRDVLRSTPGVTTADTGFFTRFLRSHLIRPKIETSENRHSRSNPEKSERSIDLDTTYEVTADGRDALQGIVTEYDRIFERGDFEPLLINPELDPYEHLRAFERDSASSTPDASFEPADDDGILGEIAESFASVDGPTGPPGDSGTTDDSEPTMSPGETGGERSGPEKPQDAVVGESDVSKGTHPVSGPLPTEGSAEVDSATESDHPGDESESERTQARGDEQFVGEFTEQEVIDAALAAATVIRDGTLVRTADVKSAAWDAVDLSDRSRGELWTAVCDVLVAMDDVHGRRGGHMWAARRFGG